MSFRLLIAQQQSTAQPHSAVRWRCSEAVPEVNWILVVDQATRVTPHAGHVKLLSASRQVPFLFHLE